PGVARAAASCVGTASAGTAVREPVRGIDHGIDRREGDRPSRGSSPDRRGVRKSIEAWHAATDRSYGHLRHRRELRWKLAQAAPAAGRALQHVYPYRTATDTDRADGAG